MDEAQVALAAIKPELLEDIDPLPIIHKWQLTFKREALQIEDELQGKTNVPALHMV